jgi:5-methylcytosine-specific restriction endonuclease McrA
MKILEKYTESEIIEILNESNSFREFLIKIGSSFSGSTAYISIKKQLMEIGIEIPIFEDNKKYILKNKKDDKDIFVQNSKFSRSHLKNRIIKNSMIEYICLKCGNDGTWMNESITLQLEHKNGISNDNRIDNLCFLCPNCHSQTETYCGKKNKKIEKNTKKYKNKDKFCECGSKMSSGSQRCFKCAMLSIRKIERPKYEQLYLDIFEIGYRATGRKYGVSDNTIRKWIKSYENKLNK